MQRRQWSSIINDTQRCHEEGGIDLICAMLLSQVFSVLIACVNRWSSALERGIVSQPLVIVIVLHHSRNVMNAHGFLPIVTGTGSVRVFGVSSVM